MPIHAGRGILIAFEGIDGAGKTTQAAKLAALLQQASEPYLSSKEPTNGTWGQKIRESAQSGRLPAKKELELFIRDREEHVSSVVQPGLDAGKVVILDRYYYSTIAYQGARGIPADQLKSQMEAAFPIPDAVFLLDIDPNLSGHRIAELRGDSPNRFEKIENLRKVRNVFLSLQDDRIIKIDGSKSIEAVHEEVVKRFVDGPLKARRCGKKCCEDPSCQWVQDSRRLYQALRQPINR
jgi:dTMP kinase